MNLQKWIEVGEYALSTHGDYNFRAVEIAPVGRVTRNAKTGETATLVAPPPLVVRRAVILIEEVLEWVRARGGTAPVHVNSWYRDPEYNRVTPGAPNSLHLTGAAADIRKDGWTPAHLARELLAHPRADRLGIGLYASFVHVDVRGLIGRTAPARWGTPARWWA